MVNANQKIEAKESNSWNVNELSPNGFIQPEQKQKEKLGFCLEIYSYTNHLIIRIEKIYVIHIETKAQLHQ